MSYSDIWLWASLIPWFWGWCPVLTRPFSRMAVPTYLIRPKWGDMTDRKFRPMWVSRLSFPRVVVRRLEHGYLAEGIGRRCYLAGSSGTVCIEVPEVVFELAPLRTYVPALTSEGHRRRLKQTSRLALRVTNRNTSSWGSHCENRFDCVENCGILRGRQVMPGCKLHAALPMMMQKGVPLALCSHKLIKRTQSESSLQRLVPRLLTLGDRQGVQHGQALIYIDSHNHHPIYLRSTVWSDEKTSVNRQGRTPPRPRP